MWVMSSPVNSYDSFNVVSLLSSFAHSCLFFFFFKGNITTAVMLDREQAGAETYTLTVLAADDAIRSRQGTTQVRLGILHAILGVFKYTKNKIYSWF